MGPDYGSIIVKKKHANGMQRARQETFVLFLARTRVCVSVCQCVSVCVSVSRCVSVCVSAGANL